jgi:DNA polymerase-3 subunit gamma/tau
VIDLTGRILRGETPAALELLYQQSESGKDMMRLMSDLIAYLRDLLVFKAKPDALKEDVDPDTQRSLATHTDLIALDRLLELIDQFATAESRMKWAPNKKLQFEIAIIKAIESLGQATLDEVIEKLGELGNGKPVAAGADSGGGKTPTRKAGITNPGYGKPETSRVAESPPKYKAEEPNADVDPVQLWELLTAKIPPQKAFLRSSVATAHVFGIEGRNFQLGFSPDDKATMEFLRTQANRKFLETLLHEITGKDLTVKLSVRDDLRSKHAAPSETAKASCTGDFKDDPLIQEALEMFNAQIKS